MDITKKDKNKDEIKENEKMVPYSLKLPSKMLNALKELSDETYNPVSYHLRQAIFEYLKKHNKL
jgi:predicted DNA-binding protein